MKLLPVFTPQSCMLRLAFLISVLAILASIADRTHTGPQQMARAKASRTRNDHRAIARALEGYYLRHAAFPAPVPMADYFAVPASPDAKADVEAAREHLASRSGERLTTFMTDGLEDYAEAGNGIGRDRNVTSTSEIVVNRHNFGPLRASSWGRSPTDPFANSLEGVSGSFPFAYHTTGGEWILSSVGPDEKYDLDLSADWDPQSSQPIARLTNKTYDPTNGVLSTGDIWMDRKTFKAWDSTRGQTAGKTTP